MAFGSSSLLSEMKGAGKGARSGLHLGAAAGAVANKSSAGVGATFSQIFSNKLTGTLSDAELARQEKAQQAAGGLVSNALILPMLKQVRRSPWAQNNVFSGGNGEKTFGPEFDRQIADRIAQSPRLGVKTALVNRLTTRNAADATNTTNATKLDVHG